MRAIGTKLLGESINASSLIHHNMLFGGVMNHMIWVMQPPFVHSTRICDHSSDLIRS